MKHAGALLDEKNEAEAGHAALSPRVRTHRGRALNWAQSATHGSASPMGAAEPTSKSQFLSRLVWWLPGGGGGENKNGSGLRRWTPARLSEAGGGTGSGNVEREWLAGNEAML